MEKCKYSIWHGAAHLSVILSVILLACLVTDRFNSAMAFVNHPLTKGLSFVLSLAVIGTAIGNLFLPLSVLRIAGRIAALPALLFATVAFVLILTDYYIPRYILFTYEWHKTALFLLALFGTVCGVVAIVRIYQTAKGEATL